jgi:hypothetical protein
LQSNRHWGSGQIGLAAFSPVVERVIVREAIPELPSEEGSQKVPREVSSLLEHIDEEQIMIQANNFLDHHGHELYALPSRRAATMSCAMPTEPAVEI